jgi:anaerobic selenocysteine-containing dehydrogenase
MAENITRTARSYCRICMSLCGILVDLNGEEIVRVRGDREHPHSRGYICPKGRAIPRMHHHPRRLERPLMRINGCLQPTSWKECLDDLGGRLRAIIDTHGPSAVGIFFGSGNGNDATGHRMGMALRAAIDTPVRFTPMTIDAASKTLIEALMIGVPNLHPRADFERTNLVIYIGINPMVSHGHIIGMPNPATMIRAVAERGEVWVIDPVATETAKFATHHMAPWPGSDYAILGYLIRELLRNGASQAVLECHAVGVEALRDAVEPFDERHSADLAGVSRDQLAALLQSVRRAGRLSIETGTGATMPTTGNLTQWFVYVLMVITDSMNRPGGAWFHPGFIKQIDRAPLSIVSDLFGPGPKSRPELRTFIGDWPCAALPDEINAGNIRAFINLGGAPMRSFPDTNALRPALERLEVFASLEIIENDSTALSTHVLPTKDFMERPDLMMWDTISSRLNMHYSPAIVGPVGDRRSAWWMLAELIRRLGHEPPGVLPADDRESGADEAVLAAAATDARIPFDDLAARQYVDLQRELPAKWVDDHIDRLGGWRLAPPELVEQLRAERARRPIGSEDRTLMLVPRRQRRHLNAYLLFDGSAPEVFLNPTDAAAAGIDDGGSVSIRNERGEMVGIARVDSKMRAGVVSVPHGFDEQANVNLLTDAKHLDPLTGMPCFSGLRVTIHPGEAHGDFAKGPANAHLKLPPGARL